MVALQAEDKSGEETDDQDHWKADRSLLIDGTDDPAEEELCGGRGTEGSAGEQGEIAESRNNPKGFSSESGNHELGFCQKDSGHATS